VQAIACRRDPLIYMSLVRIVQRELGSVERVGGVTDSHLCGAIEDCGDNCCSDGGHRSSFVWIGVAAGVGPWPFLLVGAC
jgi:hypothetical protein